MDTHTHTQTHMRIRAHKGTHRSASDIHDTSCVTCLCACVCVCMGVSAYHSALRGIILHFGPSFRMALLHFQPLKFSILVQFVSEAICWKKDCSVVGANTDKSGTELPHMITSLLSWCCCSWSKWQSGSMHKKTACD